MKHKFFSLAFTFVFFLNLQWANGQSPYLVKDINVGNTGAAESPNYLTAGNGIVYFLADNEVNGLELWKSDGTASGTVMLKDIRNGIGSAFTGGSNLRLYFTYVNGTLFFIADDGSNGFELWKSDGTAAGTIMIKDIVAGAGTSFPTVVPTEYSFINFNGTLLFSTDDGVSGRELWKSDGTTTGTVMVKDINSGVNSSSPSYFTIMNGAVYFKASDLAGGPELWKTDGTEAGTMRVKDIQPGGGGSSPKFITHVNGKLFFIANDGVNGLELWKSDGTDAGTVLVKDITSGSTSTFTTSTSTYHFTAVDNTLFFVADENINGDELWKSDGTVAGTVMVKDIVPGSNSSSFGKFINYNGTLFFVVDDKVSGKELWKSDGTATGTVMVKDINPQGSSSPNLDLVSNGILYFSADNDTSGKELWKTDGTVSGTVMIADINTGLGHSYPDGMVDINGKLFFAANGGVSGRELWAMNLGTGIVSSVHNSSVTISVYPNPFSEKVMVRITNVSEFSNNQFLFAIYNLMGEVVSQSEIRNSQSEISIGDLPSGIYFYKIKNDNSIFAGKLIIQ